MPDDKQVNLPRILVVDDEAAIRRFLHTILKAEEFSLHQTETGHAALAAAAAVRPDIILLDLGLPDLDGVEVIRRIREWSTVPIIVLSVREREDNTVQQVPELVFVSGELVVDLARRRVVVQGEEVQLTPTEYDLLRLLVTHAGRVMTHSQILRQIWGIAYVEQPHVLRVNISNLRHKIEADPSRPRHIVNEPGVGYRLREQS